MIQTLEMPKLLEKQIDRLYSLPVDAFTAARNDLARGLKASGDREAAERVRKLEKPTVVAWTVNQLARRTQRELRDLFAAVDRLRTAQRAALAGGGSAAVRAAAEAERAALQVLMDRATSILEAEERRQAGVVDRVAATLRGGTVTPESRALLESGRLTHELEPVGFGSVAGLVPPDAALEHPRRRRDDHEAQRRAARERFKGLQAEVQELSRVVKAAEGRVRDAEREAERAHREAEEARSDLKRAEADLETARIDIETH